MPILHKSDQYLVVEWFRAVYNQSTFVCSFSWKGIYSRYTSVSVAIKKRHSLKLRPHRVEKNVTLLVHPQGILVC